MKEGVPPKLYAAATMLNPEAAQVSINAAINIYKAFTAYELPTTQPSHFTNIPPSPFQLLKLSFFFFL